MILLANMHLVTGYAGKEHVTASDHGAFNAALIGTGQFVLEKGKVFEAQVISNNVVRVHDGELMMQGRFVRLNPGTYADLTIENGSQGMKRNDLIAARYTKNTNTGVEEVNLVVIKGTAAESNPVDPAYTEGDITNGEAVLNDYPLWRIPLDGLNVGTPEMLFEPFIDSMRTLPIIRQQVLDIHAEVDAQLAEQDAEIDAKIAELDEYTKNEVLAYNTKAMFGFGGEAVPNDVFAFLGKFNQHWWSVLHGKSGVGYEAQHNVISELVAITGYATKRTISYAKSITVNQNDGTVALVDPVSLEIPSLDTSDEALAAAEELCGLAPVYLTNCSGGAKNVYYIPEGATCGSNMSSKRTITTGSTSGDYRISMNSSATDPVAMVVVTKPFNIAAGETTYVDSSDRNAYPDSGTVDGLTYEYLGIPFSNAVTATLKKAEGSYVGTGVYGADAPNTLASSFRPLLVIVASTDGNGGFAWINGMTEGLCYATALSSAFVTLAWNDKGLTWYSSGSAVRQLNEKDTTYRYLIIG